MVMARIVLSGSCPALQGLAWENQELLRIGRQDNNDIVLQDIAVGRLKAEVWNKSGQWLLRDLANSERTPSYVNGAPVQGTEVPLGLNDILQFGRLKLKVTAVEGGGNGVAPLSEIPLGPSHLKTTGAMVKVQATAHRS